jgi:transposase-like protein
MRNVITAEGGEVILTCQYLSGRDARHRCCTGLVLRSISIPRYSPLEKIYSVILFTAGLSLRDLSERLCLTGTSRESVRIWVHRFSSLFIPSRRVRSLVAVDETVLKVKGQICYLWAAIDVDTNEILALYASKGRGIPSAIEFLRKV